MIQHYSTVFAKLSENIANANTTGHRAHNRGFTASLTSTNRSAHEPDMVSMGPFKNTGTDLDVAIRLPNSMLALGGVMNSPKQAEKGQHFTRDGSLQAFQAVEDPDQFMLVHGASNRLVLGHPFGAGKPHVRERRTDPRPQNIFRQWQIRARYRASRSMRKALSKQLTQRQPTPNHP